MGWGFSGAMDGTIGRIGGWALVLARVLGLCLTAPGLAVPGLSWRFRIGLAVVLAAVLAPVLEGRVTAAADGPGVAWAVVGEVLTGTILGMTAGLIVAGARAAGDLVAAQAGLATATFFDPDLGEELTPIGRLYGWIALITFLGLGGPLALVRALAESYAVVPAGRSPVSPETVAESFGEVGRALELALRAAAPAALALILAGLALAWLSRTAPSLPFLVMALPIRAVLGVGLVLIGLAVLAMILTGAWGRLLGLA